MIRTVKELKELLANFDENSELVLRAYLVDKSGEERLSGQYFLEDNKITLQFDKEKRAKWK